MLLYHGSNIPVEKPEILELSRPLDFGAGFYLTSDLNQARRWASRTAKRRKNGAPTITVFEVDISFPGDLKVLQFDEPDEAWFDFVLANRTSKPFASDFDLVIGPVANDQTILTFDLYLEGLLTKSAALADLLPQRLTDQYAFRTQAALAWLKFREVLHE